MVLYTKTERVLRRGRKLRQIVNKNTRILAVMLSLILAMSLVPVGSAFADTDVEGVSWQSEQDDAAPLEEFLGQSGSYVEDEILVTFDSSSNLEDKIETLKETLDSEAAVNESTLGLQQTITEELDTLGSFYAAVSEPESSTQAELIETAAGVEPIAEVTIPEGLNVAEAIAAAQQIPGVIAAQPNHRYCLLDDETDYDTERFAEFFTQPNDPSIGTGQAQHWHLGRTGALNAWESPYAKASTLDNSVIVAVLDSGANLTHPDLAANLDTSHAWDAVVSPGTQLIASNGFNDDSYGHGTMVSGFIAQVANNGIYGAGMANNKVKVLPVRVFDSNKETSDGLIIRGLNKVLDYKQQGLNIKVVNMSFGGHYSSKTADPEAGSSALRNICNNLRNANILLFAAAGNGYEFPANSGNMHYDYPSYPSDYASVISVTATDYSNNRAYFSEYNQYKDICAPGSSVSSTHMNGGAGSGSGTSYACPIAAGAAAYLCALFPGAGPDTVRNALYSTAFDLGTPGRDDCHGYGMVNLEAAVNALSVRIVDSGNLVVPPTYVYQQITPVNISAAIRGGNAISSTAPYRYTSAGLPAGLTVNAATGVISGAPLSAREAGTATITATDASGVSAKVVINYGKVFAVTTPPASNGWYLLSGTGWLYINDYKNFTYATGWKLLNGSWYYLDPATGVMASGTQFINGRYYHLGAVNDGRMRTGWQLHSNGWRYHDSSGGHSTGWLMNGGSWYYLDPSTGIMASTAGVSIGGARYSFNSSGAMLTGWVATASGWLLHGASGAALTGWQYTGGSWYYLGADGAMHTGRLDLGSATYFLNSSGAMLSGWVFYQGEWYYAIPGSGAIYKSQWLYIGGYWYYLQSGGVMAKNGTVAIPGDSQLSRFDSSGHWLGYV